MKKIITLKPSYATANTVRFDEDTNGATTQSSGLFASAPTAKGALGKAFSQYFDADQIAALGWQATRVGDMYVAEGARGKTYNRRDVEGPSLKITIETL